MATFGYKAPTFGAYPHSPGLNPAGARGYTSAVGSALAGTSPLSGTSGYGGYTNYPAFKPDTGAPAAAPAASAPAATGATAPQGPAPKAPGSATPAPGVYDLNTDPILQQITAFTGMGDQQANDAATQQRTQLLIGYGDPNLAASVLGANDPSVQAAGQNVSSVLSQLAQQHDQNETNYGNQLDPSLFYSGAHVLGEQQLGRDYQNALYGAGQNVQGGLSTISNNLASALGANQSLRIQGANDAYGRAIQMPPQVGVDPTLGYPVQPNGSILASDVLAPEPTPADSTFGNGVSLEQGFGQPGLPAPTRSLQSVRPSPFVPQLAPSPLTLPSLISLLGQRVAG